MDFFGSIEGVLASTMNWTLSAYKFFEEQTGDTEKAMALTDIWWGNTIDALMASANKKSDDEK